MAQQAQVMPPSDCRVSTITIGGRVHSCGLGSTIMVPLNDTETLLANGWIASSLGGSGTTEERPANPMRLAEFHDVTLGAIVRFDGKNWRHALTGAVV
jgi:hypothetical protein